MGRNRLAELQANSKYYKQGEAEGHDDAASGRGMEMQPLRMLDKDMSASTADFFVAFEENVVNNIDTIKRNADEIKVLQNKISSTINAKDSADAESKMNQLVDENKHLARKIQTTLKSEEEKLTTRLAKLSSPAKKNNDKERKRKMELNMRQTQVESQSRRFFDIWNEYNLSQLEYRDKMKRMLIRRCKIANTSFSEDQIEEMLEEGKTEVFNQCILSQTATAKQTLTELQERHDGFIKLEQSIREVRDMFVDIAGIVATQGEAVDNIMHKVLKSQDDVEQAKDKLKSAVDLQRRNRKMKMICAAVGIIVFLIVLLVILIEVGAFSSGSSQEQKIIYVVTSMPELLQGPSATEAAPISVSD